MGYNIDPYTRQLSPQTGTSISSNALSASSPYSGQSDRDAQIYNYVWDNYSYFDLDGDGIVSPSDAYMLLYALIGYSSFNSGISKIHLSANANATRTTGSAIWTWYTNHRDNTTIDRGTYNGSNIGTKGVYDIDADGSLAALGEGLMAVRIFGSYDTYSTNPSLRVISSTSQYLTPHDNGPAYWNGSTWDGSVINDDKKGIFNSMNLTPYSGSSNYPSGAAAGDVIYDSSIRELKVYDGSNWV